VARYWPERRYAAHDCIPASYLRPCKNGYPVIFCVLPQFTKGCVRMVHQIKSWLEDLSLLQCYTVLLGLMLLAFQTIKVALSLGYVEIHLFFGYLNLIKKTIQSAETSGTIHPTHPMTQRNILQDSSPLHHRCEKFKSCTVQRHCHSHPFQFTIHQPSYHLAIHNHRDFMCGWLHHKYKEGLGHPLIPKLVGTL
jgi:hypothetical protein